MPPFLRITVQGQPAVEKKIKWLGGNLDVRGILDEGAAVLFNRLRARFLAEQDPSGKQWPKSLAALERQKSGRGGGTLFDTGKLFHGLQLWAVGNNARAIGTDVTNNKGFPYPKVHNFGIGIVQRQFLGFSDEDRQTMSDIVVRRIAEGLAK